VKAVVQDRYGGPEVLHIRDIDPPAIAAGEALVRVRAASVNPLDWHVMRGTPLLARPSTGGPRSPKPRTRGVDLAGIVEAVGGAVTGLRPGDEVFGVGAGSFAEYSAAPETSLAPRPTTLGFEEAAAVPVAGVTALQLLRDVAKLQTGQRLLVNGAAGGVGTFAVQVGAALGAEVTGVCSTRNVELVRSLGAHQVVDYTAADFTRSGVRYDVILDNVANHSLADTRRVLQPSGTLVSNSGRGGGVLGPMTRIVLIGLLSRFSRQRLRFALAKVTRDDLLVLKGMIEDGRLAPVIDRTFPLADAAEAIGYVESEHARGKVVIRVAD
jgi:NADPH:quinone reductase-like Zn-dependent oxidoreductase